MGETLVSSFAVSLDMTLDRILKSVLYAIFCLSCQVRLCSVQGRARVLLCDSEKPSTGII